MNNIASRPEFLSLLKSLNDCHNKDLSSNISALNCNRRSFSQNDLTPYSFESLKNRYMENALQAYDFETLIYSNIHNYDFKAMNIMVKAHVDF